MTRTIYALVAALTILPLGSPAPLHAQECSGWRPHYALSPVRALSFAIDSGGAFYAACSQGVIVRSDDDGVTWRRVKARDVSDGPERIFVHPSGALIGVRESRHQLGISTDRGATWRYPSMNYSCNGSVTVDQAGTIYAGALGVDVVMRFQPDLSGESDWKLFAAGSTPTALATARDGAVLAALSLPNNQGAQIVRTTDGGTHWTTIYARDSAAAIYRVATDHAGRIYAWSSDRMIRSDDTGTTWVAIGAGAPTMIDPNWDIQITSEGIFLVTHYELYRSTDLGVSFTQIAVGHLVIGMGRRAGNEPHILATDHRSGYVLHTTDNGDSWTQRGSSFSLSDNLTDNIISMLDDAYLLGTCGSGIFRLLPSTYNVVEHAQIDADTVMGLSAGRNGIFHAATEEGMFRSVDSGRSWLRATDGLPDEPFTAVVSDNEGNVLALSSSSGPFRSDDDGMSWRAWSDGLPAAAGGVLVGDYRGRAIIGTGGRLYVMEKLTEGWRPLGAASPGGTVRTIAVIPRIYGWFTIADPREHILISTDRGIFHSIDAATTWIEHGRDGLPDSLPSHLACGAYGTMYAGTAHGLYVKLIGETGGLWAPCTTDIPAATVTALRIPACNDPLPPLPDILPCGSRGYVATTGGALYHQVIAAGVDQPRHEAASRTALGAHPNPFTSSITFDLMLSRPSEITLELYSPLGARVAVVAERHCDAGDHELHWNGDDLPAGIYLYRLRAGAATVTGTIIHQR